MASMNGIARSVWVQCGVVCDVDMCGSGRHHGRAPTSSPGSLPLQLPGVISEKCKFFRSKKLNYHQTTRDSVFLVYSIVRWWWWWWCDNNSVVLVVVVCSVKVVIFHVRILTCRRRLYTYVKSRRRHDDVDMT